MDLRSGALTTRKVEASNTCQIINWFADGTAFAVCGTDGDEDPALGYGLPDGRPDSDLTMYRLDVLGAGDPAPLGPLPDLLYVWTGAGTVTPDGLWLDREDEASPITVSPWLLATSGEVRPLDLTVLGTWPSPAVVGYADGMLYVATQEYEGPTTALRATSPDGAVVELFPEDLGDPGELLRSMKFVIGH